MNETLVNHDGTVQVNIVRDEHGKIVGVTAWERVDLVSPTFTATGTDAFTTLTGTTAVGQG